MLKERLKPLDGIRALAVAGTIAFHLPGSPLDGGVAGVDIFFVLSGFLIGSILLEQAQAGRLRLVEFWAARARRLFPALLLLLGTLFIALPFLAPEADREQWAREGLWASLYVQNIYFIAVSSDYFAPVVPSPLTHLWSLSVEEQFYLLFPILVLCCMGLASLVRRRAPRTWRGPSRARWWVLIFALFLGSASLVFSLSVSTPDYSPWSYYDLRARAAALLAGVALACVLTSAAVERLRRLPSWMAGAGATVSLVFLAGVMAWVSSPADYVRVGIPVTIFATVTLIACVHCPSPTSRLLGAAPLVGLGLISYGAYLWSVPISALWGEEAVRQGAPIPLVWFTCVAATLAVAFLSWKFLEMPIRQSKFLKARPSVSLSGGLASMAVIALLFAGSAGVHPFQGTSSSERPFAPGRDAGKSQDEPLGGAQEPDEAGESAGIVPCSELEDDPAFSRSPQHFGCVLYDPGPDRQATVLVVGNSTMHSLYTGLLAEAGKRNWRVIASVFPACTLVVLPIEIWEQWEDPDREACVLAGASAARIAQSGQVDAVVAMDMPSPYFLYRENIDDPRRRTLLEEAYREVFTRLNSRAPLLLVLDYPTLDSPGTEDLRTPFGQDVYARDWVNQGVSLDIANSILSSALPTGAHSVDIAPLICPLGPPCPVELDGAQLRTDQVHFTNAGALIVAGYIFDEAARLLER